jgi:phosphatidylinositol 4-phosphatase
MFNTQDTGECVSSSLKLSVVGKLPLDDAPSMEVRRAFGVVGILRLALGRYFIYVAERELCATVNGLSVYKATRLEAVRIPREYSGTTSSEQQKSHAEAVASLNSFLIECAFIFSYQWPVSHTQQRWYQLRERGETPQQLWQLSDERFYWNYHVAEPFLERGLDRYIVPMTDGFCSSQTFQLRGTMLRFTLISRRSRFRAGVRFLSRGIDPQGNVSNFVETEQILELLDVSKVMSWTQIRGSIPLFWTQLGTTTERIPIPRISRSMFTQEAYLAHVTQLERIYGKGLTLVNLIDQSGQREAHLGDEYEMAVRLFSGPNVRYVGVDFHRLTEKGQYGNLSKLLDVLADEIVSELWFSRGAQDEPGVVTLQRAVTRTNCIDW